MANEPPPPELVHRLRTSADLLLAGTPVHSSGKLTILDLCKEAQVKRWVLTHKYPTLMAKYQAEFKAAGKKSVPAQALEAKVAGLEQELEKARQSNRVLDARLRTYALMIEQLALE